MRKYSGCFTALVCAAALMFSIAFVHSCFAQSTPAPVPVEKQRHLESITLHEYTIDWVVVDSDGGKVEYHIDLRTADMSVDGKHRNFDKDEVPIVSRVSNWLAHYCIESVQWWEDKHDEKPDPEAPASDSTKQHVASR